MKKKLMLLAMLFLGIMSIEAKNEKQPTFLYGFATSFTTLQYISLKFN